ncbi:MAG: sensor histidine kinase [Kineosporiaceae bacterium]|nr:sensor histidine kinase [Kineosporiaceae bacterium]
MITSIDRIAFEAPGQPPLGRLGHAWRIVICVLLGLILFAFSVESVLARPPVAGWMRLLLWLDLLLLGPASWVLLALHRRFPMPVAVSVIALSTVSVLAAPASLLCLVSIAARRRSREIATMVTLGLVTGWVSLRVYPDHDTPYWVQLVLVLLIVAVSVAFGMYLGARRELSYSWRLRAEAADREQALMLEQVRTGERTRIAREMHDVLGHRISLVSMHAGVLALREDLTGDQVQAEARLIQRTAQEAMEELQGVLGVLRGGDDAGDDHRVEHPQPTLDDLDTLIAEARTTNPVEVVGALRPDVPGPLGRHVYRILQECLTNARKHAPGSAVRVQLTGTPRHGLTVEVTTQPPHTRSPAEQHGSTGSGFGLLGITERVEALGGTMERGADGSGGHRVQVWLPWKGVADGE